MKKRKPIIMLVEDNEDDRILLLKAFEKAGIEEGVRALSDGAEAIDYMMGKEQFSDRVKFPYPTFILTDLKMPLEDGFAVLNFLKQNPEWAVIPTIIMTGSDDPDDIRTSYMLGASAYLIKPRGRDEMVEFVSVLLAYWSYCEVPQVDISGRQLKTLSYGKLGERFPQLRGSATKPVEPGLQRD